MMTNYLMWSGLSYDSVLLQAFAVRSPYPYCREVFGVSLPWLVERLDHRCVHVSALNETRVGDRRS
jgi:hypothetical protein